MSTAYCPANDVAKFFAIIPAAFVTTYPELRVLDVMYLATESAILSAVIFNALIIPLLIPLALKGVPYRSVAEQDTKAWYRRLELLWATFAVVVCTDVCALMFPYFALSNLIRCTSSVSVWWPIAMAADLRYWPRC
jgi:hypothetical protein